jgi:heterodisulfide reductase subunit A
MARVGVFVCHCGTNIAKTVDVKRVVEAAAALPGVAYATDYQYMCSDPGQATIQEAIKEHGLDRIVVAACSPQLHEPTFRRCISQAGLNPYMYEMANIREQCSWIHPDREEATDKAIDIVRMSVAKLLHDEPLYQREVPVTKRALVIGGGIAGIQSALDIADAGYEVVLVERSPSIGGRMAQFDKTFPTLDCAACILTPKMVEVRSHPRIRMLTYSEVEKVDGFVGNFEVTIRKRARFVDEAKCTGCGICWEKCPSKAPSEFDMGLGNRKAIYRPFPQAVPNVPVIDTAHCIYFQKGRCGICAKVCPFQAVDYEQQDEIIKEKFGAIVVATGIDVLDAKEFGEYGYGRYPDVITSLQLERLVNASGPTEGEILRPSDSKPPKTVVFIQCVGSRDENFGRPYCSRVCCMYTAKQALLLKEHVPDTEVYVFYLDVRAAGKNYEEFVRRVREEFGVKYIRGRVSRVFGHDGKVTIFGVDTITNDKMKIDADLVVLATGAIARSDAPEMARILGINTDQYAFFSEAHPKLRPVETMKAGVLLAGACQFPKDIPDSVSMASATAAKAIDIISRDTLLSEPMTAEADPALCIGCEACVAVCPVSAIAMEDYEDRREGRTRRVAKVNESICQGCGTCVAACRPGAMNLKGFSDEQLVSEVDALWQLAPVS